MALKLRDRILGWSIASTLIIVLAVVLLVDSVFRTTIRGTLEENLVAGARLASALQRSRVDEWITDMARVALEPTLRASIETGDPATIAQILDTARANVQADWLAVASPEGDLLAVPSGPVPVDRVASARRILDETQYFDSGDLWAIGDTLIEVGASSLLFGELRLGVIMGGRRLDAARATELSTGTGEEMAFLAGGRLAAADSAADLERAREIAAAPWADGPGTPLREGDPMTMGPVREVEAGGERFLGTALSLHAIESDRVGSLVVFRSLDAALGPVFRLRLILLGVAVAGLMLGLTMSLALTRSVAEPLSRLLGETERLGSGNLEEPVPVMPRDEVGLLAEGFERMRVSLREARAEVIRRERLSAVGQAASALVHDFAQPVTVISAHTEFLAMGGQDEGERKVEIVAIRDGLRRLQGMMREVLEFTRGEVRIDKNLASVRALLDDVARQSRPVVDPAGIALDVTHGYEGDWVLDSQRTARALGNLVRNAASALGPGGGRISLRSAHQDGRLRIEVADDGPGIPLEIRATLFDPFVTRNKHEGTGLGLAIVKNIAESQGGTVAFTTSTEGTTFMFELPWTSAPQESA